ncbi:MAG: LysM peptidoglycan-binding domain-containing protein [Candidatus Doudnabacteria bacterium]|nr:LysM peptidoglycan-binding domain-containing protein [Candidatus Doudnabacteria bacterium]
MGKWIEVSEAEIVVKPGANKIVEFTITLPDNVSVGEENGCIMIQEKKTEGGNASGVNLSFRTGARVVVTVPGEQKRELRLVDFTAGISNSGGVSNKLQVENVGNVSIDAEVGLVVESIFGVSLSNINNQFPILRGEVSTFNLEASKPFWGGLYRVYNTVTYDPSPQASVGVNTASEDVVLVSDAKLIFFWPELGALVLEGLAIGLIAALIVYFYRQYQLSKQVKSDWQDYEVKSGDTLNSLAERYRVNWKLIARVNKVKPPYSLSTGSKLKLPRLMR